MRRFTGRGENGSLFDVWGIDAPVAGLAIAAVPKCACGAELYGVMHIRSGAGLFFTHSPETLGEEVWAELAVIDWTQSAADCESVEGGGIAVLHRAMARVPDSFHGQPADEDGDLPGDLDGFL